MGSWSAERDRAVEVSAAVHFSTSKDHFAPEVPTTCGCLLVQRDSILPIVRGRPADAVPTPKPGPTPMRSHSPPSQTQSAHAGHSAAGSPGGGGGAHAGNQVAAQPPMAVRGRSERFALRRVENVQAQAEGGGAAPSSASKSPRKAHRMPAGPAGGGSDALAAGKENDGMLFVC